MTQTVLVTGGTGFVGGWCIVELLKRGYDVRTTIRSAAKEAGVRTAIGEPDGRLSFAIADLNTDEGWHAAIAGCDYVLHVASPLSSSKDPQEVIATARDGALRVLRAAVAAKVKRVVLTSSTAACSAGPRVRKALSDETRWTDLKAKGLTPYRKSKIIAERAAWDFIREHGGATEFATVLPTGIFGPVLTTEGLGSVALVQRLLKGEMPGIPNFGFNTIDVRDVADLHIRAMTAPEAVNQQFIAGSEFLWMKDVARILRKNLGKQAAKVPKRRLPSFVLRFASLFRPELQDMTVMLDHKHDFSSAKAQKMLGWKPRPAQTAILDCARSLIEKGAV